MDFTERIFYLHVPRCGGRSLVEAITRCYAAEYIRDGRVQVFTRDPMRILTKIQAGTLFHLLRDSYKLFVHGNFYINDYHLSQFSKDWSFVTVLREPVARFISHYFFLKSLAPDLPERLRIDPDFDAFLESSLAADLGNIYVRHYALAGSPANYDEEEPIQQAINTLEKFSLVGCLENLNHFMTKFKEKFGRTLDIELENVNPDKPGINDEQVEKIRELCKPSTCVYKHFLVKCD